MSNLLYVIIHAPDYHHLNNGIDHLTESLMHFSVGLNVLLSSTSLKLLSRIKCPYPGNVLIYGPPVSTPSYFLRVIEILYESSSKYLFCTRVLEKCLHFFLLFHANLLFVFSPHFRVLGKQPYAKLLQDTLKSIKKFWLMCKQINYQYVLLG